MPPDFEFRYSEAELWTPLRLTPTSTWLQVAARLHAGVSVPQARSALEIVAHQMEQEEPKDRAGFKIVVTLATRFLTDGLWRRPAVMDSSPLGSGGKT